MGRDLPCGHKAPWHVAPSTLRRQVMERPGHVRIVLLVEHITRVFAEHVTERRVVAVFFDPFVDLVVRMVVTREGGHHLDARLFGRRDLGLAIRRVKEATTDLFTASAIAAALIFSAWVRCVVGLKTVLPLPFRKADTTLKTSFESSFVQ